MGVRLTEIAHLELAMARAEAEIARQEEAYARCPKCPHCESAAHELRGRTIFDLRAKNARRGARLVQLRAQVARGGT